MAYEMKPFDAKAIEKTCSSWHADLNSCTSIFPADVTSNIEYIRSNAKYGADAEHLDSMAYGIFADGQVAKTQASAVVKVIISKAGRRWIKMIDCHIRPKIEDGAINGNVDDITVITEIYAAAIAGSIKLTSTHKVDTVKVYGRTNSLLQMVTLIASHLNAQVTNHKLPLKVSIEGRWLVVKAK